MNRKRYNILGLEIDAISFQEAVHCVMDWGRERTSHYVCFANVHMTMEARSNSDFKEMVNQASLVLADGKPIAKSVEWLYNKRQERIAGMDFMPAIFAPAAKNKLSVFLFGSTEETLAKISQRIELDYGAELLAGVCSPPFRELTLQEESDIIDRINHSGANLVLVALGCPRQEKWMANNYSRIQGTLLGVGGAFPVYAGLQKRSPAWMQKTGLEWAYRLSQEPTRLFKRYLTTNSQFIFQLLVALSRKARV
jgi:N-acetylglucosaminyldiphosphoundecaprenol N-acetyl-beta-D-mannosaminyltransferase